MFTNESRNRSVHFATSESWVLIATFNSVFLCNSEQVVAHRELALRRCRSGGRIECWPQRGQLLRLLLAMGRDFVFPERVFSLPPFLLRKIRVP